MDYARKEYELAHAIDEERAYTDRFTSKEAALRGAHSLAWQGYSSIVTDVETGEIVFEVIVH